ncbi:MAG TPA: class I tRNA ligase family protein, partial [Thermomicrobiaceae bacterium]|nr:class I tRNA ligase family protein [Thermomicrobiaceae bacterium]
DWCISRQLWWGHRIPVWYCKSCGEITVTDQETLNRCEHCGSIDIEQDPDVLDTWFSSGLWTFSTLGWPEDTADLRYFYPGSVMETGYDIIFLWVARMIFFGLEFMGEAPFFDVYFHGTVRDEAGQRMSKTKGNVIDPTEVTKTLGSDALRFSLITAGPAGSDLKLSLQRVESNRNFGNKIWQATRFVLRNIEGAPIALDDEGAVAVPDLAPGSLADRWIMSRLESVTQEVNELLRDFQLGEAGRRLYDFLWGEYCDWYIEASKVVLNSEDEDGKTAARQTLVYVLERSLRLLHPFMPFLTEELWQHLPHQGRSIMVAPWPREGKVIRDDWAVTEFGFLMEAVRSIRNARAESNVEPGRWIAAIIEPGSHEATLRNVEPVLRALARLNAEQLRYLTNSEDRPENAVSLVVDDAVISLPLAGMVDLAAERERLQREIAESEAERERIEALLSNDKFVSRAPEAVVQKQRDQLAAAAERLVLLRARLGELGGS